MGDERIIKVGWGFQSDVSMLMSACQGRLGEHFACARSILNLDKVIAKMKRGYTVTFDRNGEEIKIREPIATSLTLACERYLGRPLNKREQISDWDQRPLTSTQVLYASLDAHSLLGVLSAITLDESADICLVRSMYALPEKGLDSADRIGLQAILSLTT
jgi:hypothetical protein